MFYVWAIFERGYRTNLTKGMTEFMTFSLLQDSTKDSFSRTDCLGKRSQQWQIPSKTKTNGYERSRKKPMKTTEADGLLSKFLQTRLWGQAPGSVLEVWGLMFCFFGLDGLPENLWTSHHSPFQLVFAGLCLQRKCVLMGWSRFAAGV